MRHYSKFYKWFYKWWSVFFKCQVTEPTVVQLLLTWLFGFVHQQLLTLDEQKGTHSGQQSLKTRCSKCLCRFSMAWRYQLHKSNYKSFFFNPVFMYAAHFVKRNKFNSALWLFRKFHLLMRDEKRHNIWKHYVWMDISVCLYILSKTFVLWQDSLLINSCVT